jgi:hypothetical protein
MLLDISVSSKIQNVKKKIQQKSKKHLKHNIKANEPISQQRKHKTIITKQTDKPTTSTSNCNVSSSKLQTDKQNKGYLSIFFDCKTRGVLNDLIAGLGLTLVRTCDPKLRCF